MSLVVWVLAIAYLPITAVAAPPEDEEGENARGTPVLVELFTTIGNINGDQASSILRAIQNSADKKGKAIYTLSYHVTYATSTGLQDPYAKTEFSDYQQEYARAFKKNKVSVPQIVVSGSVDFPAAETKKINQAIQLAEQTPSRVHIELSPVKSDNENAVIVHYSVTGISKVRRTQSHLRIALVERRNDEDLVDVDNHMRKFHHTNVVRRIEVKRITADAEGDVKLVLPENLRRQDAGVVGFVQDYRTMAIVAADGFSVQADE